MPCESAGSGCPLSERSPSRSGRRLDWYRVVSIGLGVLGILGVLAAAFFVLIAAAILFGGMQP